MMPLILFRGAIPFPGQEMRFRMQEMSTMMEKRIFSWSDHTGFEGLEIPYGAAYLFEGHDM